MEDENNIVTAQDFMCYQSCALEAVELAMMDQPDVMGYVFYHGQDADCLYDLGWLNVSYGSCDNDSAAAHLAIGQTVADTLRTVGLRVVWNGQLDHRIRVHLPKIIEQLS
ncbi:MAG: hypothetical protein EOP06_12960 [Proteobacteria bacterium]|nr:MAG: hypothetical protein EOP06_12960 [Pseudomonadota bacterium]